MSPDPTCREVDPIVFHCLPVRVGAGSVDGMQGPGEKYRNGQPKSALEDGVLTHFHSDGTVKARGRVLDGDPARLTGRWEFHKKEGFLWQVGHFDEESRKHGQWIRYRADGTVETEQHFEHGKRTA